MSDWRPIETYPNDGTPVLGFSQRMADMGLQRGFFVVRREGPQPPETEQYVTHWMPLPDPPAPALTCGLCLRTVAALAPGRTICETCAHFPLD